jgi:hypothetical protein
MMDNKKTSTTEKANLFGIFTWAVWLFIVLTVTYGFFNLHNYEAAAISLFTSIYIMTNYRKWYQYRKGTA